MHGLIFKFTCAFSLASSTRFCFSWPQLPRFAMLSLAGARECFFCGLYIRTSSMKTPNTYAYVIHLMGLL